MITMIRDKPMASMSNWTHEDLAVLVEKALTAALLSSDEYCEHCKVIAVYPGDKYCPHCVNEITDYLAQTYTEQGAVEKGLY